jgi:hypothetical protein
MFDRDVFYSIALEHNPWLLANYIYTDFKEFYYEPETVNLLYGYLPYETFVCHILNLLKEEFDWSDEEQQGFFDNMERLVPEDYQELLFM